jgi:hypothetical protein
MTLRFLVLALLAGGCNQVTLADDVDIDFDFHILTGPSDELHLPYVKGARMNIYVRSSDKHVSMDGWTVESSDPQLLAISGVQRAQGDLVVAASALEAGTPVLTVKDERGRTLLRRPIDVERPDRVDLLAHAYLIINRPDEARIAEPRVLQGGTATFLARYYANGQLLFGNGALSAVPVSGLSATVARTYLFEDRDWLQVTPTALGPLPVALSVGGDHVSDVNIVGVPPGDVASLRILGVDESRAHDGEWLVALGQAYDASGQTLFGVAFQWEVDDKTATGLGDLYRYQYDHRAPHKLCARFGSFDALATIHGAGFVDSSNRLGCQGSPGLPARSAPLYALLAAGLIFALRARRRS